MKVLLLSDAPNGWIVDRIAQRMAAEIPEITFGGYYCCLSTDEIVARCAGHDAVHFLNWNMDAHFPAVLSAGLPVVVSVRSFRFPPHFKVIAERVHVHVVNRGLLAEFPKGVYIPDPLMIDPQPLRVGFVGKPGPYKGSDLIEQACREIGAEYHAATGDVTDMRDWYAGVDMVVCASEAEGFSTIVMECLAINKPVVSTRVGVPWFDSMWGIIWVDRNVEAIKAALLNFWPARALEPYTWPNVCEQFRALYTKVVA